ncbi:MAG: trypsin-like peptidase domain-containing protein [Flavisolibacter sp.]
MDLFYLESMRNFQIFFVSCCLLFVASCSPRTQAFSTEIISADSLGKYSYPIYSAAKNSQIQTGSGFFVKKDTLTYFVSAAHVLTRAETTNGTLDSLKVSQFFIRVSTKDSTQPLYFSINTDSLNIKLTPFTYKQKPDVAAVYIRSLPPNFKIYYINDLLDDIETINPDSVRQVYIFGFPQKTIRTWDDFYKGDPTLFVGKIRGNANSSASQDSINFMISRVSGDVGQGFSGSPVFFDLGKYRNPVFAGLFFGYNEPYNIGGVVRSKKVLSQIR